MQFPPRYRVCWKISRFDQRAVIVAANIVSCTVTSQSRVVEVADVIKMFYFSLGFLFTRIFFKAKNVNKNENFFVFNRNEENAADVKVFLVNFSLVQKCYFCRNFITTQLLLLLHPRLSAHSK